MSWSHRYLGTPVLSWLLRWITGTGLADSQCGMRAVRREVLQRLDLRAPGMEFASEMLVKAARAGLRLGQVAITLAPRIGESKLQTLPDGWRHLRYLLVASPDHLFFLPGAVLLATGLAMLAVQVMLPLGLQLGETTWKPEYAPVILGAIGMQVLAFGLLARIYCATQDPICEDRLVSWFLGSFSLERSLGISLAAAVLGGAIEVALGIQQLGLIDARPALGVMGAFALVTGLQGFFSSFMAYVMCSEYTEQAAHVRLAHETAPASDILLKRAARGYESRLR